MRSQKTWLIFLLISLLLGDLATISFARRVAELDVVAVGDSSASPPAKGYWFAKPACSPASARHPDDGYKNMRVVSKRMVPQGPNPLHN
ncbi:hypothetical protein PR202_gb07114 [Eleusine coracana subsp. coracana]|uniref:Uncharacterized protein n=1 Tax=Eleusine coracana subsp. coracana TaxID=191504 RepID=A0AAV5EBD0_ELECO|nr:hypothetical protein PR202_gb07114 [Eleusine coracana subsp. coracana]